MASTVILLKIVCFYVFLKQMKKNLKSFLVFQRDLRNSEMKNFIPIYKKIGEMQKEVAAISIDNTKQVNRTQY